MSILAKVVEAVQRFDRKVWPVHRVVITSKMIEVFERDKLVIVDVGTAAGPEDRWQALSKFIHFVTFEPSERATAPVAGSDTTTFSVGLSSQKGQGTLFLMKDADASTLCRANTGQLEDFCIHEGLQIVGSTPIEVDTLDNCLASRPQLRPDFLKVDVEGADLDVLKGAEAALSQSILGVRVEVSFLERHAGTPFFGETDGFLRERGFALFHLSREIWIRRNLVHGVTSQPQVAWGDAVYFLRRDGFLKRLSEMPAPNRSEALVKFVVILLNHGVHDFAMEVIEAALRGGMVSADLAAELKGAVISSVDGAAVYLLKSFGGVLFAVALFVITLPAGTARRQQAGFYVKQRAGRFFQALWRMAARGGPHNSCISD
jgi:FkbM family methyltransferase